MGGANRAIKTVPGTVPVTGKGSGKGKRGRKASGLRDLQPELALAAITGASVEVCRHVLKQGERAEQIAGQAAPTLERMLKADVLVQGVEVEEAGITRVRALVRADTAEAAAVASAMTALVSAGRPGSAEQMLGKEGVDRRFVRTAGMFLRDVEAARPGALSASYSADRVDGGRFRTEQERVAFACERLVKAQTGLTRDERAAVWGVLVFGLPLADVGWAAAGRLVGTRPEALIAAGGILLLSALERMTPHYQREADKAA